MLWYKSWLETRWRFLIGLALLICSASAVVMMRPQTLKLLPLAENMDVAGEIGRRIREAVALQHEYRGYIWTQWFRQNLAHLGTLFAVLLGTGGILAQSSGGAALFTLSMPVTRGRLLAIRAATGLAEWFALAFIPSLLIPILSPSIGESYSLAATLIHSACLFLAGAAFFSLAFLLSTLFNDLWRPLLISLLVAVLLGAAPALVEALSRFDIFGVMSADVYFRTGTLPWLGLLAVAAASAAMLYAAAANIVRHDF
jgi:ABC-type transport system involved in multi-copper enzyme maturation permease subunit